MENIKAEYIRCKQLNESQQQTNSNSSQELTSLAPQVLTQVKNTLVRKLGVDATSSMLSSTFGQEHSSEEKSKNDGKYVSIYDRAYIYTYVDGHSKTHATIRLI